MSGDFTIGQLARACGVSRTTLLYYEKLGLLAPAARSAAGYRRYTQAGLDRLRQVCVWRAAGLSLDAIGRLVAGGDQQAAAAARLDDIERDMAQLRTQQALLVRLLNGAPAPAVMDKEGWSALFRGVGMDQAAMLDWHRLFEARNPHAHEAFLRSLGLGDDEVTRIRAL